MWNFVMGYYIEFALINDLICQQKHIGDIVIDFHTPSIASKEVKRCWLSKVVLGKHWPMSFWHTWLNNDSYTSSLQVSDKILYHVPDVFELYANVYKIHYWCTDCSRIARIYSHGCNASLVTFHTIWYHCEFSIKLYGAKVVVKWFCGICDNFLIPCDCDGRCVSVTLACKHCMWQLLADTAIQKVHGGLTSYVVGGSILLSTRTLFFL